MAAVSFKSVWGQWLVLVCAWALPGLAWSQLSFITSSQAGFSTPTFTHANLKTVDFSSSTLAASSGITVTKTLGSSGGAWSEATTGSTPTGFVTTYAKVSSGSSSSSVSKVTITFSGGTSYVSFLWNLATGDSDNTVKFNLSNSTSVSVSNCSTAISTCVGGYDSGGGLIAGIFSLIFGSTSSTQSARLVYQPPSGVTITSVELTATSKKPSGLLCAFLCGYESRSLKLDSFSYVDNSSSVPAGLHHVEVLAESSAALTCRAMDFKVRACANAACTSLYTGGVTGNITVSGSGVSFPSGAGFTIPAGSSTSGLVSVNTTSTGSRTVGTSSVSPTPTATGYCGLGATASNGASACTLAVNSTGLVVTLPDHRAGTAQTLKVSLLKKPLIGSGCVAATTGVALGLNITPVVSGATGVLLGGSSVASGVNKLLSLSLSSLGEGTTTFQYNDVGVVNLQLSVASLPGLGSLVGLVGGSAVTVAPAAFKVEPVIGGVVDLSSPVKAGSTFQVKISALNGLSTPTVTPGFGSEVGLGAISLGKTLLKPATRAAGAPNNPALTLGAISFVNGVATVNVSWDEVGTLDLTAALSDYLGTGLGVTGALTGVVASGLRFVPDRFDVEPVAACGGAFTYAGQPFSAVISAVNADGDITRNYDGSQASVADRVSKATTVSALSGAVGGSFTSGSALTAAAFANGQATTTMIYNVTNKLTAPAVVKLQAKESSGTDVTTSNNPDMTFRSGRIKLSNAFGSEKNTLQIPLQVQYWSGKAWVPAIDDTCTLSSALPLGSFGRGNYRSHQGAVSSAWSTSPASVTLNGGVGFITLASPGAKKTGTVDITLDLTSGGANLPWLRSTDARCPGGVGAVCNPSARATFGVYQPETKKTVNTRDVF